MSEQPREPREVKGRYIAQMGALDVTDAVLWVRVTRNWELRVWADPALGPDHVRNILQQIVDASSRFVDADPDSPIEDDLSDLEPGED